MESVRVTSLQFFALNEPPFLPLKDKHGDLGYRYLASDTLQCCGKGNLSRLHFKILLDDIANVYFLLNPW